jgi:subtilisin family serine protease
MPRTSLVLLAAALAATSFAVSATAAASTTGADVLVRVRSTTAPTSGAVLARAGGHLVARELDLWRVPARTAARAVQTLDTTGDIVFAQPERTYAAEVSRVEAPDPLAAQEWWRAAIGVDGLTPPGPGVPVTIVDSGVDLDHPEFAGRPNLTVLNAQEPQPFGGIHGTSVASVVGAQQNGVGVEGVYPEAVIRSWDAATGAGTELTSSQIVSGILAAAGSGRSVINLNLSRPNADAANETAVKAAVAGGSLVVAASGNDGERGSPISYPAAFPHVLTVAATQPDGAVAPWSSTSRFVDLAAPGAEIPVATIDTQAGTQTWALADGTSFAAPIVSGAAAWIWTVRPTLDAGQLAELLRASARDIGPPGRDTASGFGLLDVPAALTRPAPTRDGSEPDDDVDDVTPGRPGYHGTMALTRPARTSGRVAGRVDAVEDPRDVFRVWLPKGRTVVARLTAGSRATLSLVRATATSVAGALARPHVLGTARVTTGGGVALTYRNGGQGRFAFLVVRPSTTGTTSYGLAVTAR